MVNHIGPVRLGKRGEVSKIEEELDELRDFVSRKVNPFLVLVECADIIESVGQFSRRRHCCPLVVVYLLCVVRAAWKPLRDLWLNRHGNRKEEYFLHGKQTQE